MMLPFNKSIVIIPTYNEIDNINKMLTCLHSMYPELSILIIDDGSPDKTAQEVKNFKKDNLFLIERAGKLGLGTAYIEGFRFAIKKEFDYIFEMDCDFSHNPEDLSVLLTAALEHDLVIGSRYIDGIRIINWPFRRLLLSYFASLYTRFITGSPLLDATGGFKCFKRATLESLNLDNIMSNGYSFQFEVNFKIWSKGLSVKEVPIIFTERRDGESKMDGSIVFEAVFSVIKLRILKLFGKL